MTLTIRDKLYFWSLFFDVQYPPEDHILCVRGGKVGKSICVENIDECPQGTHGEYEPGIVG